MRKSRIIAICIIAASVIGGLFIASALWPSDKNQAEADTSASGSAADGESKEEQEADFEATVYFDIDNFDVDNYIAKTFKDEFAKDSEGNYLIEFSTNSMPSRSKARANSSVKKGLRDKPISDAAEFVYNELSKEDVKRVLSAKLGDTITVDDIKALCKEYKRAILSNPVLLEGFINLVKDMRYQDSKSFGEINPWTIGFLQAYKKARKDGEGISHWLFAYADDPETAYVTKEYYTYAVWFLAAYIDMCEVNVEKLPSKVNYHLAPGQKASQTKLTKAEYQEDLAALTFGFVYKDEVVFKIGSNLYDKRPEIFAKIHAKVRSKRTPSGTPLPKPHKSLPDPNPGKKGKPTSTPAPTVTPTPTPTTTVKPKDSEERPTAKPKDDTGPGEPEATPRVGKSPSDDVGGSQYTPVASPQTGGSSQPPGSLSGSSGATTTAGGQTATDVHDGNGNRTEWDQAETNPINPRGSDTGGQEGGHNGSQAAPY